MRYSSESVGGVQVFAVSGTNTVAFGVSANANARTGLLGFAIERKDTPKGKPHWLRGYKVFPSSADTPGPDSDFSTHDQPIQSLVWDDSTTRAGHHYTYTFHPLKGTPAQLDRTPPPVTIEVDTERLYGESHDVFFNRGVASSQAYAHEFNNLPPDKQPTEALKHAALDWLSRDLDEAILRFIDAAKPGDRIRGCFYEFTYLPILAAFVDAIDRGVDVRLVVDSKVNADKYPLDENNAAISTIGLPESAIIPRAARTSSIAHNKFMVLVTGKRATPKEVWTGSTNLTDGGIHGQANVGHWVRDKALAKTYLDYWTLLSTDPGGRAGDSPSEVRSRNAAFYAAVNALSPTPAPTGISTGITPIFSPRSGLAPLDLYVSLLAGASGLACATFPFTLAAPFKSALSANTPTGPLCLLLLDSADRPNGSSKQPYVALNSKNNVYEASGSEIKTPLGRWVAETNTRAMQLNLHVEFVHCKFLLHDPLGPDPIVVTGSANFSAPSTNANDENMIVVRGNTRVADIYFTEFARLFDHYYFRSVVERVTAHPHPAATPGAPAADDGSLDLRENDTWLKKYSPGSLRTKRANQFVQMSLPPTR
jgi:phosphatidylserine/phosphatidylglycerophosphate/cardiolipin synthase-like enzyme